MLAFHPSAKGLLQGPRAGRAEGDEGEDPAAAIENVEVNGGDTYYIKVTNPEDAEGTAMEWYEFIVYVADFSIGNYGCPP